MATKLRHLRARLARRCLDCGQRAQCDRAGICRDCGDWLLWGRP